MINNEPGEVLFEFTQIGNSVRVTAIDAATGIEVTIQAPVTLGNADMQRAVLKKLDYVIRKRKE